MPASLQSLVGVGVPPDAAQLIATDTALTFAATGTTQPTAALLSANITLVTTASGAALGLRLPPVQATYIGEFFTIVNRTAQALTLWPAVGGTFNALVANTPVTVAAGAIVTARIASATNAIVSSATPLNA